MNLPERLKYARNRADLTLLKVCEKAGLGQSSLSEFENSKREPSLSQLNELARVYNRPVEFFLSDDPIPREEVLWRAKPQINAEAIEGLFLRLCNQYRNLEIWNGEVVQADLPVVRNSKSRFTYADAEELAKRVRSQLQLGGYPGQILLQILEESCGIKVFHVDFEPSGTAACTFSDETGPAILLNKNNKRWRRNFDLAHELFHLLTWQVFRTSGQGEAGEPDAQEEKFATCFARNLLMPQDALKSAINKRAQSNKVAIENLFDIARQFDVSIEALIWQLSFVFNFSKQKSCELKDRASSLSHLYEERSSTEPPAYPERYRALAIRSLRHDNISTGRFADYMSIGRREARKYISEGDNDSDEIRFTAA
ncbi:MAG: ImmA/IrrE family metallo-endopeptidase [Proteobacteria bacterium]|nr:ImmA/IrrE family metallo-endopeptidase [Pseudomonadota bacterium]